MAKYKGNYRTELDEDDTTYSEEMQKSAPETEAAGPESDAFKKRYGDLRRHMQQKEASHQQQLDALKDQLDQATRKQIKFPKSAEEIEKWAKQYPDVAQIVETIAGMKANEALQGSRAELDSIRKETKAQKENRAYEELLGLHPDFPQIRDTEEFHEWAEVQPQYIRDALYKNATDAHAAARALDLYKADTGVGSKRSKAPVDPKDAAREVGRSSSASPTGKGKSTFSESMVQRMSDAEYDKNEAAILESMQTGKFNYDITGAAR